MKLTCNKQSALRITRAIRRGGFQAFSTLPRTDLIPPDPSPRKRWTSNALDLSRFGLAPAVSDNHVLHIAVGNQLQRPQMKNSRTTVYASKRTLPRNSFVDLGQGLAISCPELLFIELAETMQIAELLLLGHELCGSFSRDPDDPRNGDAVFDVTPITSTAKIAAYLDKTRFLRGAKQARRAVELLSDNAWSPTESVVATVMSLPTTEFGYGLGACTLNKRIPTKDKLGWTTDKSSRVPDILIAGTRVGINYDGAVHLNLDAVIDAAIELERHPEHVSTQIALDDVVRSVRAKAIDDIRRNRELIANGYIVFPVVKEDLYEEGGLDRVVAQAIEAVETFSNRDMSPQKRLLRLPLARIRRQELIWSLMPGRKKRKVSEELKRLAYQKSSITEVVIGF